MFYKPIFCCNCGEKIDRIDWNLLTSRRFCQLCETEKKPHDLLSRAIVGLGLMAGVFGFGSYLQSGNSANQDLQNPPRGIVGQKRGLTTELDRKTSSPAASITDANSKSVVNGQAAESNERIARQSAVNSQPSQQTGIKKTTADEPVYFCGAMTKKGTACSHKVKTKGAKCWQHSGRNAGSQKITANL